MKYELDLKPDLDGEVETVKLDSTLTLYGMRKMQNEGLISKNFLSNMAMAESDPTKANLEDMLNAPYIAYRNANPNGMTQEEFEARVDINLEMCGELYAEIIKGEIDNQKNGMANSFRRVTSKKK